MKGTKFTNKSKTITQSTIYTNKEVLEYAIIFKIMKQVEDRMPLPYNRSSKT